MEMQIKKLTETAAIPSFAHDTDAGMDLYTDERIIIMPGAREVVRTGIAMAIPEGYVGLIWDKSGVAAKRGLKTFAGVIDAGYRGEVMVCLYNAGAEEQRFEQGDKIAQMLIQKVEQPTLQVVDDLDETLRGEGGFGSTGR